MDPGPYLKSFRKHYFFWLDDESLAPAESLLHAFGEVSELFDLSFARGLYSALQVLDAIKNGKFRPFDIAVLDVRLAASDQYFSKLETIDDTTPFGTGSPLHLKPIYVDDKAELNKINEFSGTEHFGFDLDKVKGEAAESGGLFVWSWAIRVCGEAKYIIYSASDLVRSRIDFLRIAGVLEICNKLELFHRRDPREYVKSTTDPCFARYSELAHRGFEGVNKITYIPLIHNGKTGDDVFENVIVEREKDFLGVGYFTSAQRRMHSDRAMIIHEMHLYETIGEVKIVYERYDQFLARTKISPPKPYIVERVVEMVDQKIERNEIDTVLARAILTSESLELWTIQIANEPSFQLPAHLLPLGGSVDLNNRTIRFERADDARDTYTLPSFFLPWGRDLLSDDKTRIQGALEAISAQFGDKLKNGCGLMRRFCKPAPFHAFIEQAALNKNKDDADKARTRLDELKMSSVLLDETEAYIKDYLDAGPPYRNWESTKEKVELTFKALLGKIEAYTRTLDSSWKVEITPKRADLPAGKWYADMDWIEAVLVTILNNLAVNKAFDATRGFADVPNIRVSLTKESEPARINIVVEDNGIGLNCNDLCAPNTGYDGLLQGQSGKLLRSYGSLTVRSTNGECDLGTQRVNPESVTKCGTLVTFSIILG